MSEEWQDIKRKSQKATKQRPDMGECVIEIHTTSVMPDRWVGHLKYASREIRYDRIVRDLIVAKAQHPKAVPHVVAAIDGAIKAANARYRVDLGLAEDQRARQEGEAARLVEQQAELDKIMEDIPDPE